MTNWKLQLIRKPDRDWNQVVPTGSEVVQGYNSLENPIGIETRVHVIVTLSPYITILGVDRSRARSTLSLL